MGVRGAATVLALGISWGLSGCCLEIRSTGSSATTTTGGQGTTSGGGTSGGDLCASVQCPGPSPCAPDETFGSTCDPADGKCKCYPGGAECVGGSCDLDGGCIAAPPCMCGNQCPPNELTDSNCECRCVTEDGPTCQGNSCRPYFADSGLPVPTDYSGDAAIVGQCGADEPCYEVTCRPFEACDPSNVDPDTGLGRCECGEPVHGVPGVVCSFRELCVVDHDGGAASCRQICQPFGGACPPLYLPDASAPVAQGCYLFTVGPACAPSAAANGLGQGCQDPTDCAPPLTCGQEALSAGVPELGCVSYCDVFPPGGPTSYPAPDGGTHACVAGTVCVPLTPGIAAGTCEPE